MTALPFDTTAALTPPFTVDELESALGIDLEQELKTLFKAADKANQLGRGTSDLEKGEQGDFQSKHEIIGVLNELLRDLDTQEIRDEEGNYLLVVNYLQDPTASSLKPDHPDYVPSRGDLVQFHSSTHVLKSINFPASLIELSCDIPAENIDVRGEPRKRERLSQVGEDKLRTDINNLLSQSELYTHYHERAVKALKEAKSPRTSVAADKTLAETVSPPSGPSLPMH